MQTRHLQRSVQGIFDHKKTLDATPADWEQDFKAHNSKVLDPLPETMSESSVLKAILAGIFLMSRSLKNEWFFINHAFSSAILAKKCSSNVIAVPEIHQMSTISIYTRYLLMLDSLFQWFFSQQNPAKLKTHLVSGSVNIYRPSTSFSRHSRTTIWA